MFPDRWLVIRGLRILVADDSDSARRALIETLESMGFEVFGVGSGDEAVVELHRSAHDEVSRFGLVFLDNDMPGEEGFETLRRIRGDERIADTPLVLLLGVHGREEAVERF